MENITKFADLVVRHDYYCAAGGRYREWATWTEFHDNYRGMDIDLNLIVRWDIVEDGVAGCYSMYVFILHQRRGYFAPQRIDRVVPEDFASMKELLGKHYAKLQRIWAPFSS